MDRKLLTLVETVAKNTLHPRFKRGGSFAHLSTWNDRETGDEIASIEIAGFHLFPSSFKIKTIAGPRTKTGWVIEAADGEGEVYDLGEFESFSTAVAHLMSEVVLHTAGHVADAEVYATDIAETASLTRSKRGRASSRRRS